MSRASCSPSRGEKSSAFCASFIAVMITPMRELPQALYRARDERELDRLAIEQGTSGYELMTRAGAALLRVLRGRWPRARRLTVVCGAGNNGGDGFVVARLAHEAGLAVTVIMPRPPAHLLGEALSAHEELSEAGLETQAISPAIWTSGGVPVGMCHAVGDAHSLRPLLTRANVGAIGPGRGQSQWGKTLLDAVLDSGLPLVVDADALNLLARDPLVRTRWVLTPHPGEAARLLDCTASEVQADRFAALHALRARYGGVVVLKGAGSLILGDDEVVR